ncbi:hypothetical protein KHP62_16670 [Rhodobacteraceae bacterium NNCM2]|nr:hypothetical protein [Coraliihabitans acroporae]
MWFFTIRYLEFREMFCLKFAFRAFTTFGLSAMIAGCETTETTASADAAPLQELTGSAFLDYVSNASFTCSTKDGASGWNLTFTERDGDTIGVNGGDGDLVYTLNEDGRPVSPSSRGVRAYYIAPDGGVMLGDPDNPPRTSCIRKS